MGYKRNYSLTSLLLIQPSPEVARAGEGKKDAHVSLHICPFSWFPSFAESSSFFFSLVTSGQLTWKGDQTVGSSEGNAKDSMSYL